MLQSFSVYSPLLSSSHFSNTSSCSPQGFLIYGVVHTLMRYAVHVVVMVAYLGIHYGPFSCVSWPAPHVPCCATISRWLSSCPWSVVSYSSPPTRNGNFNYWLRLPTQVLKLRPEVEELVGMGNSRYMEKRLYKPSNTAIEEPGVALVRYTGQLLFHNARHFTTEMLRFTDRINGYCVLATTPIQPKI